jgi:Flp pilus assembly CpaF family ATPase
MPVIRDATRRWLEQNARSGLLPASAGSQLDELAAAVHDRRYGLGPLSVYLRDPQVENVDINGCDQNLPDSPTRLALFRSASVVLVCPINPQAHGLSGCNRSVAHRALLAGSRV